MQHACESGWIYETDAETGARFVRDRCMVCNEPPWYRTARRRRIFERFWPLIFVAGVCLVELGGVTIGAWILR